MNSDLCDLCGLPLTFGTVKAEISGRTLRFCCFGCRQVYIMLMEQTGADDPERFRETEIYQRCVEAGVIPGSLEDLKARQRGGNRKSARAGPQSGGPAQKSEHAPDAADPRTGDPAPDSENRLSLDLQVSGMWCPACAWVIEESLKKAPGVSQASCLFSMDRVRLTYDPVVTTPKAVMDLIRRLGYQAQAPGDAPGRKASRKAFLRFGISAFLTMNVMMLSFALYSGFFTELSADAVTHISWPIVIMAAIVFFYGGAPIHRKAITGLMAAAPGMEALITIGAASAFGYSFYNWLQGSIHLYFDTASMLITLVLIGKAVESWVRDRVQAQLGSFFALQPTKARIISEQFPQGRYADAKLLSVGDRFRAMADETLAADGRVIEGSARMDESSLTGEARPVDKGPGDEVSAGTRVIDGDIRIKATAVEEASMVGQLTAIMARALENKTGLEDVTDRVLRFFVPGILLLALTTGIVCLAIGLGVRESWIRAVTVMVISCPCALGVAIPLARVAGISLAGQAGILVHDFSAFERIHQVGAFVFDKTGTLTKGSWQLLDIQLLGGHPVDAVLAMAAGLEAGAAHYVGEAIVHAAEERGIAPQTATGVGVFENGVSGTVGKSRVLIGAARFVSEEIPDVSDFPGHDAEARGQAVSNVYMTVDGRIAAVFRFGDSLRETGPALVAELKRRGLKVSLISGDGEGSTRLVGERLGISDCQGGMRPAEKAAFVNAVKAGGDVTAMVGDGINDVPALASADLGIAVHSGRRIGKEASAVTLMGNQPGQILDFWSLAGRVTRTIRQNLLFSFIYNTISIPVAMSGLLNPLVAVTAMMLSSLSVTGNTLRLSMGGGKEKKRQKAPLGDGAGEVVKG